MGNNYGTHPPFFCPYRTRVGPQSNIEKITNNNNVSEVLWDQMSRIKRGDESKNYFPPTPPTRIPYLLTPDLFYVRFLDFSVFHFLPSFFSFWTPLDPILTLDRASGSGKSGSGKSGSGKSGGNGNHKAQRRGPKERDPCH